MVDEGQQKLTCIMKLDSIVNGKVNDDWGTKVDQALGLCALTDGYIDKVHSLSVLSVF